MYFGAKQTCCRKCPHKCVAITTEVLFPLCFPSVVEGDSRIRNKTKKWKTWSEGLILPFRKQTHRVASGFCKNVLHLSSTLCSFGLHLPDSHFIFWEKLLYLQPRNFETLCHYQGSRLRGRAHDPCQTMARGPVDVILWKHRSFCLSLCETRLGYHLRQKRSRSTRKETEDRELARRRARSEATERGGV